MAKQKFYVPEGHGRKGESMTRRTTPRLAFVAAVTAFCMAFAGVALADNINDNIDSGGGVSLVAGDPSPANNTATVKVVGNAGGEPGCDIDAGESLTITFDTPTGVTATPASVTFTACAVDHTVAFTASASAVSGTVTAQITNNTTGTASSAFNNNVSIPITVTAAPGPSDTTAPVIGYTLNPASPDGSNDWYKSDVTLTWTVTENESPGSLVKTGCVDQNITTDQTETSYSCSATSDGGSAGPVSVSIKKDGTKPTNVAFTGGGITDGAEYYFGSVPAGPTACSASDATSEVASCDVTGGGSSVGQHSYTATATDNAGNTETATLSYTVLAWTLSGFYAPVDRPNTLNVTKNGSTVPLKFEVFAGQTELTSTSVVSAFVTGTTCASGTTTDAIEEYATGSTALRYDTTSGQFIFNWKTPKQPGTCWKVVMTTQDASSIYALFNLK